MTEAPAAAELHGVVAAGYPVVYVDSWEEERLAELLTDAAGERPLWRWSAATGFLDGPGATADLKDPLDALTFVADEGQGAVTLMQDLPPLLVDNPRLVRAVRDVYDRLADAPGVLVMSYPGVIIPDDLGKELYVLGLPLPSVAELQAFLQAQNAALAPDSQRDSDWLAHCAQHMRGISINEARDLFRRLVAEAVTDRKEATEAIRNVKARLLRKEGALESLPVDLDLDQIGGLRALKKWIRTRHELFSSKAQEAGIEPPSGLLLMGVSGCGKSLAAKIIPAAWNLPLIRLDMNQVMAGVGGSPEIAWARALATAESASPVVLWIDEIENSFGYMNGAVTSGNMTIFSSFLTWMQEKSHDIFVVATANKIEMLPAEMLRKGRFDQLFFLDLPKPEARGEILKIHIRNQGGNPDEFDIEQLCELVDGWTAAEIEQMVRSARLDAFYEDRDFVYDDLMRNSFRMVPLSKTMAEQIMALRAWAMKRATPAD
ncbi:MAG: AAA family ATPase [Pseudomonadota bacterium]